MAKLKAKKLIFGAILLLIFFLSAGLVSARPTDPPSGDLIINEFLANNGDGLLDEDGDHSDWVEIYNHGDTVANLSGWALTDDPAQPQKWPFPEMNLESHEYLVVFASGKDRHLIGLGTALHTNFKLDKDGDFLALYNPLEERLLDASLARFPEQFRDISYGRYGAELAYGYLAHPTPGGPNDETEVFQGMVAPVEFSAKRGFYETPLRVELTTATPNAAIYYTTDGTTPSETHGMIYTDPLTITTTTLLRVVAFKSHFLPTKPETQSYLFPAEVLHQPANPPGLPLSWGAQLTQAQGYTGVAPIKANYEMSPVIVNDPRYRDTLKEALKSIPTLSLGLDRAALVDILTQPSAGQEMERPVSVELIYPYADKPSLHLEAGIGAEGTGPKEFFRLLFKNKYGPGKLNYPLLADSPVEEFNSLELRPGVLDEPVSLIRDQWLRDSQAAMLGLSVHGLYVHLYLNGLYWGVYNLTERPDTSFIAAYMNDAPENWFIANSEGPLDRHQDDKFDQLDYLFTVLSLAGQANPGLKIPSGLDDVETIAASTLDPIQFSDFLILNWYAAALNWPENNWRLVEPRQQGEGQGKFLLWNEPTDLIGSANPPQAQIIRLLFNALNKNPDFKIQLADRMYRHLFNDGALTAINAQTRWRQLSQTIDQAVITELARWGDADQEKPPTPGDWLTAREEVTARMDGAVRRLIAQARQEGYYPPLDPPLFSQASGLVPAGFTLTMSPDSLSPNGQIYYTTDGSDPRLPVTGRVGPTAITYTGPVVLTQTTTIKARGVVNGNTTTAPLTWSALHQASFSVTRPDNKLRLTEIMYNPVAGDDYEFIELKNIGNSPANLANLSIVEGIQYSFPPDTPPLAPGKFIVLVSNPTTFAECYPGVAIRGVYEGHLSNKGEKITLIDTTGQLLLEMTYNDENGWPINADGRGDSLTLIDEAGNPNDPQNWRASLKIGGSPGSDEVVENHSPEG